MARRRDAETQRRRSSHTQTDPPRLSQVQGKEDPLLIMIKFRYNLNLVTDATTLSSSSYSSLSSSPLLLARLVSSRLVSWCRSVRSGECWLSLGV